MRIGVLSEKYEGGGAATVSTGEGDSGGVSYGTYQLATNTGSVAAFVEWLLQRSDFGRDYGNVLNRWEPGSREFSAEWIALAETDPVGFGNLQDEYVKPRYYDAAVIEMQKVIFIDEGDIPDAVKCVIFSNAIQHGVYWAGRLVGESYDSNIERWIRNVYNTKLTDLSWSDGAPSLREGLFNRWRNERDDAIALLNGTFA